jgi:hypothetical protein
MPKPNDAETAAYRKAFDVFINEFLTNLGVKALEDLVNTSHQHTTLMTNGQKTMVCITRIHFSDSDEAIKEALATYQGNMGKG